MTLICYCYPMAVQRESITCCLQRRLHMWQQGQLVYPHPWKTESTLKWLKQNMLHHKTKKKKKKLLQHIQKKKTKKKSTFLENTAISCNVLISLYLNKNATRQQVLQITLFRLANRYINRPITYICNWGMKTIWGDSREPNSCFAQSSGPTGFVVPLRNSMGRTCEL